MIVSTINYWISSLLHDAAFTWQPFIYELQKSTTIAFSRNSLYTFYSRNPTCGIPPCLRISNRKYPPCPQNSIIVNPPSPSEILKAVRGIVWIFSGIAHLIDLIHFLLSMAWQWKPVYSTFSHQNKINDNLWPSTGLKITFGPWPVMLIGQISFSSVMAGFWLVNYL